MNGVLKDFDKHDFPERKYKVRDFVFFAGQKKGNCLDTGTT